MYRVLIIDDDSANCLALVSILKPEYSVYVLNNSKKAIDTVKANNPDVILLDINMPDRSGFEVLSALKVDKATEHYPVIFVSALFNEDDINNGLDLGANDYISKPFDPDVVREKVYKNIKK